jgi:hypothetical protein
MHQNIRGGLGQKIPTQHCTTAPAKFGKAVQQQSAHLAPYAMGVLTRLLLASCIVCCAASGHAETHQISAPIFAWSSVGYFSGGHDKQSHVQSLEVTIRCNAAAASGDVGFWL